MNIIYLDYQNYYHRSYHSASKNTNGPLGNMPVFFFLRGLRALKERLKADKVYVVLEGVPVKRLAAQGDYKGTREYKVLPGFVEQSDKVIEVLANLNVNIVRHADHEADDTLANLITSDTDPTHNHIIVSSDTDFIQLISDNVSLYNPIQKKYREFEHDVSYVEYKSLIGDGADNIEGFRGIGPKRALALLENSNKLKQFLDKDNNREKFEFNKVMINFEYPDNFVETIVQYNCSMNEDRVKELFEECKFNSLLKEKAFNKFIDTMR